MTWQVLFNPSGTDVLVDVDEVRYVPAHNFGFANDSVPLIATYINTDVLSVVPITWDAEDQTISQAARNAGLEVTHRNSPEWVPPAYPGHLSFEEMEEMIRLGRLSEDNVRQIIVLSSNAPVPPGTIPGTIIARTL